MSTSEVLVLTATVLLSAGLLWFFFGSRPQARRAAVEDQVQRLDVLLKGGYNPQHLEAVAGLPLEVTFDRQESGDCTSRVVFPDFAVSAALAANQKTVVRLVRNVSVSSASRAR
jgi:Cu+-exporting ATPase